MKEESEYILKKMNDAFASLKGGAEIASDELTRDGVIQRFEFTFELLWKTLKVFLKEKKGIICKAPKDCLKEAFRLDWIDDEKVFLEMLEDRNEASHIYNKFMAEEIYSRIKGKYVAAIEGVMRKLKEAQ